MDPRLFGEHSPGKLLDLADGDHAFLPHGLPPDWRVPEGLWPLLVEARSELSLLAGTGRALPNPAILLRPLEDLEAIRSSRLEGTYATPRELLLFEIEPREAASAADPANDWREVFNYRQALHAGVSTELPLSLRLIRELHRVLLEGVRGRDRSPGEFRRIQVALGSSRRFVPPPPERVPECLDSLEKYLHQSDAGFDPLIESFLVHYQFETIHPFVDGNGRVGRLLLALMIAQKCRLSKPWLYLSAYFEQHRDEYIQRLFEVSAKADWSGWIEFCLRGTIAQSRDATERCARLLKIREEHVSRLPAIGGSIRLAQIVERIFSSPFLRIADLARDMGVSYPTAKADVERLVVGGILSEVSQATPKTYYAPTVFAIAYDQTDPSAMT